METWVNVALAALWVAAAGQLVFVAVYSTRPWQANFVGKALFWKSLALGVVLVNTLVSNYWTYPYQLQVSVLLLWFVAVTIVGQLGALIRQIRLDRRG